MRLYCLYMC